MKPFFVFNFLFDFCLQMDMETPKVFSNGSCLLLVGDAFVIFPFSKRYKVKCLHSRD